MQQCTVHEHESTTSPELGLDRIENSSLFRLSCGRCRLRSVYTYTPGRTGVLTYSVHTNPQRLYVTSLTSRRKPQDHKSCIHRILLSLWYTTNLLQEHKIKRAYELILHSSSCSRCRHTVGFCRLYKIVVFASKCISKISHRRTTQLKTEIAIITNADSLGL